MNDEIIAEIKRRVLLMIVDNPHLNLDLDGLQIMGLEDLQLILETAAIIGASVALEKFADSFPPIPSEDDSVIRHLFDAGRCPCGEDH